MALEAENIIDDNNPNRFISSFSTQTKENFERLNIPLPTEPYNASDANYVSYGLDPFYYNKYPIFLLDLYNGSSTHSSIINSKVDYLLGDGLITGKNTPVDIKVNAADTFEEFLNKIALDFLIFEYFAVEVVYNNLGKAIELHHVPAQKVRTNRAKTQFWFDDYSWLYSIGTTIFDRWNPAMANPDGITKLFYYDGYFPSINNVYPRPEYHASINSIATDIAINEFNLNNIKNHFSVSSIITFFMGSGVTDDTKRKVLDDLKRTYTGENGNKIMIDFQSAAGKAAEVQNLSAGDWDKAYTVIKEASIADIMIGHSVTSPELFGLQTPGKLGGNNTLEVAYEIFKNKYVRNRRNKLLAALDMLFVQNGFVEGPLSFKDRPLFANDLSETMKEKIMTLNELRAEAKLPPIPEGDQLLGQLLQGKGAQQSGSSGGANAAAFSDEKKKLVATHLTEEDYEKIKDLGTSKEEFDFLDEGEAIIDLEHFRNVAFKFSDKEDIANYIIKNGKGKDIASLKDAIQKDLNISISTSDLKDTISDLTKSGVIGKNQPDTSVQVMYQYSVRPGLGAPIIETTRPFCAKLINNDRVYSRQEIQQMSAIFGYDIFQYGGGFYHDPESDETTPFCRHQFKAITAVKRKKA